MSHQPKNRGFQQQRQKSRAAGHVRSPPSSRTPPRRRPARLPPRRAPATSFPTERRLPPFPPSDGRLPSRLAVVDLPSRPHRSALLREQWRGRGPSRRRRHHVWVAGPPLCSRCRGPRTSSSRAAPATGWSSRRKGAPPGRSRCRWRSRRRGPPPGEITPERGRRWVRVETLGRRALGSRGSRKCVEWRETTHLCVAICWAGKMHLVFRCSVGEGI
jgi:hypothetical protein